MVKGTHENIINAFFRLAYQNQKKAHLITMVDIAEEAGISRQSIYRKHFKSVDEILDEVYLRINTETNVALQEYLVTNTDQSFNIFNFIETVIFPLTYKHRLHLKILYNTSLQGDWKLYLTERYMETLLAYKPIRSAVPSILSDKDVTKLLLQFTIIMISHWLQEDFPDPPEIFASKYSKILNSPLICISKINNAEEKPLCEELEISDLRLI